MVLKLLIREGPFYKGNMHGVGYLTSISSADRDEVLMRHNELVCQLKGDKLAFNYLLDTVSTYVSFRFLLELSPGTQVEIQDADGNPIPGFSLADAQPSFGDSINRTVSWKNGSDVSSLSGKPVRLHFVLNDADLYAIKFE